MTTHIVDIDGHSRKDHPTMCGLARISYPDGWNPRSSYEEDPRPSYCPQCVVVYNTKYSAKAPVTKADMVAYVEERLTQFGAVAEMKLKPPATKPPNRLHINYDGNRDTPSLCGATGTYWNMFSTWESRQGNYTYCPECDRIAKLIQGHADKLKTKLANLKQMLGD